MRNYHNEIIAKVEALGYQNDRGGLCYGIAFMGMQAILAEEVEEFNKRIDNINGNHTQPKNILPFYDGVVLYASASSYPFLFEKNIRRNHHPTDILPLVTPVNLDKGGGVYCVEDSLSVYTQDELRIFFDILNKNFVPQNGITCALVIHSCNHTITIGYTSLNERWIFIDANQLPAKYLITEDIAAIVKKIFSSFLITEGPIALSTEFYGRNGNKPELNVVFNNIKNDDQWKNLHTITQVKAMQVDSLGGTCLLVALLSGSLEKAQVLIEAGANVNQATQDGVTPLHIAAQNGHLEIVKALITANADLDKAMQNGSTPLYIAAENGHLEIVQALIAANADVNRAMQNGATPLTIAKAKGHKEIVLLLEEVSRSQAKIR